MTIPIYILMAQGRDVHEANPNAGIPSKAFIDKASADAARDSCQEQEDRRTSDRLVYFVSRIVLEGPLMQFAQPDMWDLVRMCVTERKIDVANRMQHTADNTVEYHMLFTVHRELQAAEEMLLRLIDRIPR